ncbi:hypothetical protein [Massilia pseudoviolaceinigra]|uniref:hypothetical protein n=1 Tax=Massilia pseudoviolaceinigra TaxID=3057165 RepID=UPI0027965A70|nr:hypothetical protein [Massilia sp. CCM 9206]MDQ1919165.1 hypothetical protein [Massilia sp. CCM 9206]
MQFEKTNAIPPCRLEAPRQTRDLARSNKLRQRRHTHAEFSLHDRLHRAVWIVLQMFDSNSTPAGHATHVADRQCGVVQEQVPVLLELDNARWMVKLFLAGPVNRPR